MSDVLVDSSVLVDLATRDTRWSDWSRGQLRRLGEHGALIINQVIYAEAAIVFRRAGSDFLEAGGLLEHRNLPWPAAALAGAAHTDYRRRGGTRDAILADFLIGAHAQVDGLTLLTRDPRRIRTAFPAVSLVYPDA